MKVGTYRAGVEGWWSEVLVVGADVPVVLPAHTVRGVVLAAWLAARRDNLPGQELSNGVVLDGRGQCALEQRQHSAAGCRRLAEEPTHGVGWYEAFVIRNEMV